MGWRGVAYFFGCPLLPCFLLLGVLLLLELGADACRLLLHLLCARQPCHCRRKVAAVGVGAELGWLVGGSVIGSWVWMTMAEVEISSSADIVAVTSTLTLATDKLKSGASAVKITARVLLVREALAALPNSDDTTSRMVVAEATSVEVTVMVNPFRMVSSLVLSLR